MTLPPVSVVQVSVVVVSRGRAADLCLCLTGLSQLDYPAFEIILVADTAGLDAAKTLPFYDALKTALFEEANISAARNIGICEAAGEIVAFIDDDAVPEPLWLKHLVAGFADPDVGCAGGFVRGRNGISFQWKARSFDHTGLAVPLDVDETHITILTPQPGRALKTEGTNMALRRDLIAGIGGFDPLFRFYLDETDVNQRLADAGHKTAYAPFAQVHHGYKASATRRADRVPRDLTQIAASTAVFVRKHGSHSDLEPVRRRARKEQQQRVLRHLVSGALEPRDVRRLLKSFDRGWQDGMVRPLDRLPVLPRASTGFKAMPTFGTQGHCVMFGWHWQLEKLRLRAAQKVQLGIRCSAYVFSPTHRRHRVEFTADGVWLQTGGVWGQSVRGKPIKLTATARNRLALELKRIAQVRGTAIER